MTPTRDGRQAKLKEGGNTDVLSRYLAIVNGSKISFSEINFEAG